MKIKIIISLSKAHIGIPNPKDYLVATDKSDKSTWHLPVQKRGRPNHRLMGAAWAALTKGYRGNLYSGPNKGMALKKLRAMYKHEGLDVPE